MNIRELSSEKRLKRRVAILSTLGVLAVATLIITALSRSGLPPPKTYRLVHYEWEEWFLYLTGAKILRVDSKTLAEGNIYTLTNRVLDGDNSIPPYLRWSDDNRISTISCNGVTVGRFKEEYNRFFEIRIADGNGGRCHDYVDVVVGFGVEAKSFRISGSERIPLKGWRAPLPIQSTTTEFLDRDWRLKAEVSLEDGRYGVVRLTCGNTVLLQVSPKDPTLFPGSPIYLTGWEGRPYWLKIPRVTGLPPPPDHPEGEAWAHRVDAEQIEAVCPQVKAAPAGSS